MISLDSIKNKLYNLEDLTYKESYQLFDFFIKGEIPVALQTSILTALKLKKETPTEIAAAAEALIDNAKKFPKIEGDIVDIVGTGGDGFNTINISTTAAIVAATAGYKVAKHGGRSVSSKSGSFDLLETLDVNINLSPEKTKKSIEENNLGFLFAPFYNDGFKYVKEARSILKTRTIFNILGPLINPARPKKALIGVYSKDLILPMAKTLSQMNIQKAIVVHGSGLDEVAIHDITYVAEVYKNGIKEYILKSSDFGIDIFDIKELQGGSPEENSEIIKQILLGEGTQAQNNAVAVNVALTMKLFDKNNLVENTKNILALIKSGECYETLVKLKAIK
ncbi:anthranilate phosphoribosyltransferase [Allofrancisella guangzhouensis]|uniref:Anthranilate phosphoribosyltransferase n=1 Tax=Allofrancisella guangzhouensis TaxID=594679 RepID=A0A0A8E8B0_9GAMM|nr:anthranilate phosphoribosyltransferase [Allofrancisella guangzhouensis]AJC48391.1 anthranilate phosphoribosyltransferase [Allofrancisella guangzhouensis]MBK2026660.1 anthranilate phosphoribosyltransferase [Allofrancisella guangzhouensis]MBK2043849.1 anthranilate phosphoribosyltransferase [Allofrancisella guangzhouensis]MBK2045498.1 anthranilate phosphoribosyltransferase [Allofrancisella guangzhouensis]